MADLASSVHHRLVDALLASGKIPTTLEIADQLAVSIDVIEVALDSLALSHGLVLHPHEKRPWVIHPFSCSPTATWVEAGDRGWWAPCLWCACGVATLAGGNAVIHARIGGESEDVDIHIVDGAVLMDNLWVHFAVPPRAAWDNVHHFCASVLPFRTREDVRRWSDRHGIPHGAVISLSQCLELGREWYARHADIDWRKWSVRDAAGIFEKVGLCEEFWRLPVSEGGF
ncbi:organomercurial lyase [Sphingomonas panacis]|uniref:organomercurial lyase n=1 Tax=Sphingomonas panacis TaxID=1560345 RepID=UPI0008411F59|nr:organomercurial lyase [Sphingomonas panacis]